MADPKDKEAPTERAYVKPRTDFVKGWLASIADDHDVIAVRRTFVDICEGDLLAGIIFSQIFYYNSPSKKGKDTKLQVIRDGHRWLAKTYKDWWDECRINEMTARRKIELLKALGLIETGVFRFAGNPTLHIRIDFEQFEARYNLWMEGLEDEEKSRSVQNEQNQMSPVPFCSDSTVGSVQFEQNHVSNLDRSYTKTTTQTSAKTLLLTSQGKEKAVSPAGLVAGKSETTQPPSARIPAPKSPDFPRTGGQCDFLKALNLLDGPAALLLGTLFKQFTWDDFTARQMLRVRRQGVLTDSGVRLLARYFRESSDLTDAEPKNWKPGNMKSLLNSIQEVVPVVRRYAQFMLAEADDPSDIAQRRSR